MSSQALDLLLDIDLPVTVRLGSAQMTFGEIMGLNTGSVVPFGSAEGGLVEVLVNGKRIARGEMVVVQGNYGVRITEISGRPEPSPGGSAASKEATA